MPQKNAVSASAENETNYVVYYDFTANTWKPYCIPSGTLASSSSLAPSTPSTPSYIGISVYNKDTLMVHSKHRNKNSPSRFHISSNKGKTWRLFYETHEDVYNVFMVEPERAVFCIYDANNRNRRYKMCMVASPITSQEQGATESSTESYIYQTSCRKKWNFVYGVHVANSQTDTPETIIAIGTDMFGSRYTCYQN